MRLVTDSFATHPVGYVVVRHDPILLSAGNARPTGRWACRLADGHHILLVESDACLKMLLRVCQKDLYLGDVRPGDALARRLRARS
jgi:hypothetical protein